MSAIPVSVFADRLQELSHEEFGDFVADLWSLAGWETRTEDNVIVANRDDRSERLLVVPSGRLARMRSETPPGSQFDRIVSPRIEEGDTAVRGAPDKPVFDASDLRHRLVYGCEDADAEDLWTTYFGTGLREDTWETAADRWTYEELGLVAVALVMVVGGVGILTFGLPFLGTESPSAVATTSTLEDGLDVEIEPPPARQTREEPTATASGRTVYVGTEGGRIVALEAATGQQIWSTDIGIIARSPLVVNGTVYARTPFGVHALSAVTGEQRWTYDGVTNRAVTRPTVVDGTLYVGDGTNLVALDTRSGTPRWNRTLGRQVTGSPTVHDGTVYAASPAGVVYALDATTGETEWSKTDGTAVFRPTPIAIPDARNRQEGSILVSGNSDILAFDADTGEKSWTFQTPLVGGASPPVVVNGTDSLPREGTVVGGESGNTVAYVADIRAFVYALDTDTGERIWTYENPPMEMYDPVVGSQPGNDTAHSLYVLGESPVYDDNVTLVAINASSGEKRWEYESNNATLEAPTVANGAVWAGTVGGELLAVEADTGRIRLETDAVEDGVFGPPTVVDNPVGGDSIDTHVRLGLEGHHDWLTGDELSDTGVTDGLSILDGTSSTTVATGESVRTRLTLANRGGVRDNGTVVIEPGWESEAGTVLETRVELAPGETEEVTVTFPAPAEPGRYTTEISLGDNRIQETVRVTDRPRIEVVSLDDPGQVWYNDDGEIIASIRNTGNVSATAPVALEFNGQIVNITQETIDAGETISVTFSLSPGDVPAGNYTYTVGTNDDVNATTIEVLRINRREDVIPIVSQVFGVTLLLSGLVIAWRVVADREPFRRRKSNPEQ